MGDFARKLIRAVPALPYIGLGLWFAWAALAFGSTAWLSESEPNGMNIGIMFMLSSLGCSLGLIAGAVRPQFAQPFLTRRWLLLLAGVVSSLSCVVIVLAGPFYLQALFPPAAIWPLGRACAFLSGLGFAPLLLKSGALYSSLVPRRAILYSSLSTLIAVSIYYIVVGSPSWQPVAGGPSLAGAIGFCVLPLATAACAALGELTECDQDKAARPPSSFAKLCLVIFVFSLVAAAIRALVVVPSPLAVTIAGMKPVMLARIVMALAFALMAVGLDAGRLNFGKFYSLIMVVVVVLVACCPLAEGAASILSWVITFMANFLEFILWCILAFVVYQKKLSPTAVFGWGFGLFTLGSSIGWVFGVFGLPSLETVIDPTILYLALASMVLIGSAVVFSERDFGALFESHDVAQPTLDEILDYDIMRGAANSEEGERRFGRALELIGNAALLTRRESDVLRCLAMGYDGGMIAKELGISWHTVRTHTTNVYAKLGVHSKREVIELVDARVRSLGE